MNKSSLFTLFIGAIFVVIVAEIAVDGYLKAPVGIDGKASVLQNGQGVFQKNAVTGTTQSAVSASGSTTTQISGSISASLLQKAGLGSYAFKSNPYAGKLLDRIDFAALNSVPSFESHLMKNDVVQMASFYEFDAGSAATANDVYGLIKLKCIAEVGAILNETNSFGDASFYVNYYQIPEKVFVVFRKGVKIFAFVYNKDLHGVVGKLIGGL